MKQLKLEECWGKLEVLFPESILAKIYDTNFSVIVKQRTMGKVQFQFSKSFLLVLTKVLFWEEDWALGYNYIRI